LVVIRSADAQTLVQKLAQAWLHCLVSWKRLRISFHAYRNEADVDAVFSALAANVNLVERRTSADDAGLLDECEVIDDVLRQNL
jgi:hypothetical protein